MDEPETVAGLAQQITADLINHHLGALEPDSREAVWRAVVARMREELGELRRLQAPPAPTTVYGRLQQERTGWPTVVIRAVDEQRGG